MLQQELSNEPRLRRRDCIQGRRIRVAMVGCGAMARENHLPVLMGHEDVELAALVDRDVDRAKQLAKGYRVDKVLADVRELHRDFVDAVVVATPPFHHAPCSIDLARRGFHVLVEKPMAFNLADAEAMVQTADEAGIVLAVGLFRRLLPCTRLAKRLLDSGMLGRPISFDVEEGEIYN